MADRRSFIAKAIGAAAILAACIAAAQAQNSGVTRNPGAPVPQSYIDTVNTGKAQSRLPMLTAEQLPPGARARLGLGSGGVSSQSHGIAGIPFTTRKASTATGAHRTIRHMPYAAAGKLFMDSGSGVFVCSASIIDRGLLVTAAHCVADFGLDFNYISAWFQPARNKGAIYYGTFSVIDAYVPTVYLDGDDVCDPLSVGIVCENDLAVLVTASNGGEIADVVGGYYGTANNNYGYVTDYPATGRTAALITQIGYPVALHGGSQMIRTDSLGEHDAYNNVYIGSDQTSGSSGGPWLVNFGTPITSRQTTEPEDNLDNRVVATTSWGFNDDTIKLQGASRFGNNTNFPTTSNIDALRNAACTDYPSKCY